jgi:hypothetical protein
VTRRRKPSPKVNNKPAKQPELKDESNIFKNLFVYIIGPVVAGLLIVWLTPLPQYIKSRFGAKSRTDLSSVLIAVRKTDYPCEGGWVVRKPPSAIPRPPSSFSSDWGAWVRVTGAADNGATRVTVTIQARPGQIAYITGIHFNVLKRRPPIRGTLVYMPCGGSVLGRFVDVDLDYKPPRIIGTSSDPNALVGQISNNFAPLKLPYEISNIGGLVLIVYAQVKKCDCIWSADILWSSDGRNGSTRIDNHGTPFETTAPDFQTAVMPVYPSN